jgi:hypothetical protein
MSLSACGGGDDDLIPTPTPIPSGQSLNVVGTAFDLSTPGSPRPVSNLRLRVRRASPGFGAVGGEELADVVTDEHGRYVIEGVSRRWLIDALFFETAPGEPYKFLCPFYPIFLGTSGAPSGFSGFDLPVVPVTWSGTALPSGMWIPGTSVMGTVSERIGESLQGVGGATVTLDEGVQDPPSTTSDSGFYMICSVTGTDQVRTITVRRDGYRQITRETFNGGNVDFELVPN